MFRVLIHNIIFIIALVIMKEKKNFRFFLVTANKIL